jgi:hypothetical protein
MIRRLVLSLALLAGLAACVAPPKNYDSLYAADPHSILVVPPVNRSTNALAAEFLLSTIPRPLAERGYYVFPVNLVRRVLEDDGLADADMVHAADPAHLGHLFGADTILYATIEDWTAQYLVIDTIVKVDISYVMKETATGQTVWQHRQQAAYNVGNSGGGAIGLVVNMVAAAIARAAPDHIRLARQANRAAFGTPDQGLPAGPHYRVKRDEKGM